MAKEPSPFWAIARVALHEGRTHAGAIKDWAHAARIVFAMSPNSASCERVFSLLKQMFGVDQKAVLGDYMQAALMLRYNKRVHTA